MLDYTLSVAELATLRDAHRKEKKRRLADRLKAVYLLGSGWTAQKVSEALLADEDTIRNGFHLYQAGGQKQLLYWQVGGSKPYLSVGQQVTLKQHVTETLHSTCKAVGQYIQQPFQVTPAPRSVSALLGRLGFSHKKPKVVPGKADAAAQTQFIAHWETLKANLGEQDDVYFMDAMHPQHNTQAGYGWIRKGQDFNLRSNTGRERLNINGAFSFKTLRPLIRTEETINAQAAIRLLEDLEAAQPAGKIHIIADNARYYQFQIGASLSGNRGMPYSDTFFAALLPEPQPDRTLVGIFQTRSDLWYLLRYLREI